MRENWGVLLGLAIVMAAGGVGTVAFGLITKQKREKLERARRNRCSQTRKEGHGNCCILCGRAGVASLLAAVYAGRKAGRVRGDFKGRVVHLCKVHRRLGGQKGFDLAEKQRSGEHVWYIGLGAGSILIGLFLGTALMVVRWKRKR